jgi:hypothetical protein
VFRGCGDIRGEKDTAIACCEKQEAVVGETSEPEGEGGEEGRTEQDLVLDGIISKGELEMMGDTDEEEEEAVRVCECEVVCGRRRRGRREKRGEEDCLVGCALAVRLVPAGDGLIKITC